MKGHKSDAGFCQNNPGEREAYDPPPGSAAAYIPPTDAPKESKYHTLDMKAVRLAPDIDPQRMKTQMALRRLPSGSAGPSPSMWVSLALAGAAVGLAAWWCVQWWREQEPAFESQGAREHVELAQPKATPSNAASIDVKVNAPLPEATLDLSGLRQAPGSKSAAPLNSHP